MRRLLPLCGALLMLCGAGDPVPTYTVDETTTVLTIRSSTPGTFVVTAKVGPTPGELQLGVDKNDDGTLEFGSRMGGLFNNGLAGSYRMSCTAKGYVPEFESIRLLPTPPKRPDNVRSRKELERWNEEVIDPWMDGIPHVLIEHYDDGNVHIVLDVNRDGAPEAEETTDFVLAEPARSEFCVKAMPTRPGLPRPPGPAPQAEPE